MKKTFFQEHNFNRKTIFIPITFLLLLLGIIGFLFFPKELKSDYTRLSTEEYNSVFLSMYPIDNYEEEIYAYWRGMDAVVTSYEIPNFTILEQYLNVIEKSGNTMHTIYLGVEPDKVPANQLKELLTHFPDTIIEIVLPYPSMDYWQGLSEAECGRQLQAYRDFANVMMHFETTSVYFFGGSEWLIANPANYEGAFLTTAEISETLMLHSDRDHGYRLNPTVGVAAIDGLEQLIAEYRSTDTEYPNLEGKNIVFFGDSVIGNYTNTTSIPGVTGGLTGANVYNLGYGGGRMTQKEEGDSSFPNLANAFLTQDISSFQLPEEDYERQFFPGLEEYIATAAKEPDYFVINYGLNDYFNGVPISSEDPYDTYTFAGAFRTSVVMLQKAYPDANIIVATPNFTINFNNGLDYNSDYNHNLEDYANALIALAEEMNVSLLDNFNELDINAENHGIYLSDGCHPNELGRFLMGQRLALKSSELLGAN